MCRIKSFGADRNLCYITQRGMFLVYVIPFCSGCTTNNC